METSTDAKSKKKTPVKTKGAEKMPKKTSTKPLMKAEKSSKSSGKLVAERIKADIKPSQELKKMEAKSKLQAKDKKPAAVEKSKDQPKKDANKEVKKLTKAEKSLAKAPRMTNGLVDTASPENKKKWHELHDKFIKEKAAVYSMSGQYEVNQPVEHKVLGWGYILSNMNDRIEVLFETGIKILISNYKSA